MRNTHPSPVEQAETILFIKMILFRYPYLRFRETRLRTVCWTCIDDPVDGLPEQWMLIYLYQNQESLRLCLSMDTES